MQDFIQEHQKRNEPHNLARANYAAPVTFNSPQCFLFAFAKVRAESATTDGDQPPQLTEPFTAAFPSLLCMSSAITRVILAAQPRNSLKNAVASFTGVPLAQEPPNCWKKASHEVRVLTE